MSAEHPADSVEIVPAPPGEWVGGSGGPAGQVMPELTEHDGANSSLGRPSSGEDLRREAASFPHERQHEVLGADGSVSEVSRLADRELQHLLRPAGQWDAAGAGRTPAARTLAIPRSIERAGPERSLNVCSNLVEIDADRAKRLGIRIIDRRRAGRADDAPNVGAHILELDPQQIERASSGAGVTTEQAQQEMLGPEVAVIEGLRFLPRRSDRLSAREIESLEHPVTPSDGARAVRRASCERPAC